MRYFLPFRIRLRESQLGDASVLPELMSFANGPATHRAMGLLLVRQKNLDEAVKSLGKPAELDPTNVR